MPLCHLLPQMKYNKEVKIEPPILLYTHMVWAVNVQKENGSAWTARDFMVSWSRWTHGYISTLHTISHIHTYIHNEPLFPSHISDVYSLDGGEEIKSEESLLVICVHLFIQPTVIKNWLVMSGTALVLEMNRQTRHGVCLWGALHVAGGADKKVSDHNTMG